MFSHFPLQYNISQLSTNNLIIPFVFVCMNAKKKKSRATHSFRLELKQICRGKNLMIFNYILKGQLLLTNEWEK